MFDKVLEYITTMDETVIDEKYKYFLTQVRPMTGAGIVQLLNNSVSLMDDDKCYFEVGIHRGSTLVGAAWNNPNKKCYGVDNFAGHNQAHEIAPFSSVQEGLKDAIRRLAPTNVDYCESDYLEFFRSNTDVAGMKAELYMYDGDHQQMNQYYGIKNVEHLLADKAIIFIDDSTNNDAGAVWYGIKRLLDEDKRFSFVREFVQAKPNDLDGYWCGMAVLKFER